MFLSSIVTLANSWTTVQYELNLSNRALYIKRHREEEKGAEDRGTERGDKKERRSKTKEKKKRTGEESREAKQKAEEERQANKKVEPSF
ncbi:hypothetical protein ACLB2K_019868 [Fragaria x ananassa]